MSLALIASIPAVSSAQEYDNTPVEISREKVRIDGQVCYSHIVLEKQTLYSISKAYGVSIEDIYRYNPSVRENGLKKNSILIIPVQADEDRKDTAEKKEIHQKKEAGETLKKKEEPLKKAGIDSRKVHIVKWYEDIESIALKYGVGVNALMKANNLTSRKLSKRLKLIIPEPGEYPEEALAEAVGESFPADTTSSADTLADVQETELPHEFLFPKKSVSMSLLLPLKADGSKGSRQNMDFYSGVLLAVKDMQEEGISTEMTVTDIADGFMPNPDSRIMESDIIIGPVASGDITRTLGAAPGIKALVSPLDPRAEGMVYSQKRMIHAPTPHSVQYNDLVSWMKEDMKPGDRVIFITEKGARNNAAIEQMTAAVESSGIEYEPLSYSILEGRNVTETLACLMTETNTNRVYIASESEAFVNDVVRNLNVMIHQKYDVVLYAPSKIRGFETIEVENFHNTSMHVSAGYDIDYEDAEVKEFLLKYRALFNTEPTQFAYQGYDLAKFFIGICSQYGNGWMSRLEDESKEMLQSTFMFIRTPEGGYINNGVRRIVYGENWSVEKVR